MNKRKRKKHFKKLYPQGWGLSNLMNQVKFVCLDITKQNPVKRRQYEQQEA